MEFTSDFFNLLIDFGDDWKVTGVESNHQTREIILDLKFVGYEFSDPDTFEECSFYDYSPVRLWRHLDILDYKCYIRSRVPRIKNSQGKVKQLKISWANNYDRHTFDFERQAIKLLQFTQNQTKTAEFLRCDFKVVNKIMQRSTERGLARRKSLDLNFEHLSIDEKSFKKGHTYVSVLSNPTTGLVIDVCEGRSKESVKTLLTDSFSQEKLNKVNTISLDMWKAYLSAAQEVIPKAEVIHDRFHLVKYLNDAVDKVRRREVKENEILKRSKYVFLKNFENLTTNQLELFEEINARNFQVSKAWRIKENFKDLFGKYSEYHESKELFEQWVALSKFINIKEINKVVKMFYQHIKGVINALSCDLSNAMAERLNGKIQLIKSTARGFHKFENFRNAILFFTGGLNLLP